MTTTIKRPARSRGRTSDGAPAPGPPMDPRLRQRRTAVLRQQGRHRLRILIVLLSVPLIVVLGIVALRSSWLSVHSIRVTGEHQTTPSAVQRALSGAMRHPMMSVDVGALEADVDALPWVQEATVSRSWPSTLVVRVTERAPVASVVTGSSWAEVDANGRVLAVVGSAPAHLPQLGAPASSPLRPGSIIGPRLRAQLVVASALPGSLRPLVAVIGPEADGGVELALAQPAGAKVEIGSAEQLGAKMSALQTVLAQVDLTGLKVIDVRVPGQPALTRS